MIGDILGMLNSWGLKSTCWLQAKEHILFEAYPCRLYLFLIKEYWNLHVNHTVLRPLPGHINNMKMWSISHKQISGHPSLFHYLLTITIQGAMEPWMVNVGQTLYIKQGAKKTKLPFNSKVLLNKSNGCWLHCGCLQLGPATRTHRRTWICWKPSGSSAGWAPWYSNVEVQVLVGCVQ